MEKKKIEWNDSVQLVFVEYSISRTQHGWKATLSCTTFWENAQEKLKRGLVMQDKSLAGTCGYNAAKRLNRAGGGF